MQNLILIYNQYHRLTLPPSRINISPHFGHTTLLDPRAMTLSFFNLVEKGKLQPHFLHLMWIISDFSLYDHVGYVLLATINCIFKQSVHWFDSILIIHHIQFLWLYLYVGFVLTWLVHYNFTLFPYQPINTLFFHRLPSKTQNG